jgi:hypothetical protein
MANVSAAAVIASDDRLPGQYEYRAGRDRDIA